MKTTLKHENNEILVQTLKHVRGVTSYANHPKTPKLWAILLKMAIKRENDEFLVITLKHVSGLTVVVNLPTTPKLWAVAHENGRQTRK